MKKIQSKNEGAKVVTTYTIKGSKLRIVVDSGVWRKFKLIEALMVVLVTCKNKDDPFKNEGAGVVTTFLLLQVNEDFLYPQGSCYSAAKSGRSHTCKLHKVLLLLTFCLLLLPLWESVIVLCFVVRYFMSILVLQSSSLGRESWLLCLVCLPGVL